MTENIEHFEWNNGKYAVDLIDGHRMIVYRKGEPWPTKQDALVGDNFVLSLLQALREAHDDAAVLLGTTLTAPGVTLRHAADLAQDRFQEQQGPAGIARVRTDLLRTWADQLDAGVPWAKLTDNVQTPAEPS